MKVTIGEKQYAIEFEYNWTLDERVLSREEVAVVMRDEGMAIGAARPCDLRERTTCRIRDLSVASQGDGKTFPVVVEASVVRYKRDTPNREVGRKRALAKALDALGVGLMPYPEYGVLSPARRNLRRAFWEAFLNRKRAASQAGAPR